MKDWIDGALWAYMEIGMERKAARARARWLLHQVIEGRKGPPYLWRDSDIGKAADKANARR